MGDLPPDALAAVEHARQAPIVANTDPDTSHVAAARVEPKRITRKVKVLVHLIEAGDWVSGSELIGADIGGSEGLRRLRELRAEGWNIEQRPSPTSATAWEYRLGEST